MLSAKSRKKIHVPNGGPWGGAGDGGNRDGGNVRFRGRRRFIAIDGFPATRHFADSGEKGMTKGMHGRVQKTHVFACARIYFVLAF